METSKINSHPCAEIRTIGIQNPEDLSEADFFASPHILYHGAAGFFEYDQTGENKSDSDAQYTAGEGLYCTDSFTIAEHYAKIRGQDNGVVITVLPKMACMLDCRGGPNLPIPENIIREYIQDFRNFQRQYTLQDPWWVKDENDSRSAWVQVIESELNAGKKIDLRKLLQTGFTDNFRAFSNPSPIWNKTMNRLGIDGVIYSEGIDEKPGKTTLSYVFYNSAVIGTFQNWQTQRTIEERVESIM